MATVRNLLHEVGNWHNKISIIAGVTRELLTDKDITGLKPPEIKEKISKVIKALNQVEQNAVEADKLVVELKEFVYKLVDPDTEMTKSNPSKGKEE